MTSPQPTPTKQPESADDKAVADAIAAEHATIYGYGFVSAHSMPELNDLVSDSLAEHRAQTRGRDPDAPIALGDPTGRRAWATNCRSR